MNIQKFIIDYYDIIININIRIIITLIVKKMIHMIIFDIKTACLHGVLKNYI